MAGGSGKRRALARCAAPVTATALVLSTGAGATVAQVSAAEPKPPSWGAVKDARKEMERMSTEVGRSKARVEAAEGRMARAQQEVDRATADVAEAESAVRLARQAVADAKAKVDEQEREIAKQQRVIDALLVEVSKLARRSYIQGGEYQSLEMIFGAASPGDYANQREAVRRTSRENEWAYDKLVAARAELEQKLVELEELQEAAKARETEAQTKQDAAKAAKGRADAAREQTAKAVNARNTALEEVESQLRELRGIYEDVLARYEAAHAGPGETGSTSVPGARVKTLRSGRAVIDWAMPYVGNGSWYDNLCLGFVDDAYGATSGRMPRAIDQWYRALNAGYAHPGDRTPPVGAQVFWWSPNDARHVALYAGGGLVITTGGDGDRVAILSMDAMDAWGPYLGWAPGYYG